MEVNVTATKTFISAWVNLGFRSHCWGSKAHKGSWEMDWNSERLGKVLQL